MWNPRPMIAAGVVLCAGMAGAQTILANQEAARREAFWKKAGSGYRAVWTAATRMKPGPVDDLQAQLLARAYFTTHLSGCGGPERALDKGKRWLCHSRWGYAGTPGPDIWVDKATGATYSKGRPKVTDPRAYAKNLGRL